MSYEGVFGKDKEADLLFAGAWRSMPVLATAKSGVALARRPAAQVAAESAIVRSDVAPPTPEERKRRELQSKLDPAVARVIEHFKNLNAGPPHAKFIRNGKAEVQVWLADTTTATLDKLRKLGFEVLLQPKTAKIVIGRLPAEKLVALAELPAVRYIAPAM